MKSFVASGYVPYAVQVPVPKVIVNNSNMLDTAFENILYLLQCSTIWCPRRMITAMAVVWSL